MIRLEREALEATAPLSSAQQRFWLLGQLGGASLNLPWAVTLTGRLNLHALEQAISRSIARHAILRTRFVTTSDGPRQQVADEVTFVLGRVDAAGAPASAQAAATRRAITAEVHRPFDLGRPPLLRGCVVRLADERHVLLVTTHHLVADEWSLHAIVQEISAAYAAFGAGTPADRSGSAVPYARFAAAEREQQHDGRVARGLDYWARTLAGMPPLLPVPTDRPRPARRARTACRAAQHGIVARSDLETLARAEHTTLFVLLLTALAALLARYSGCEDVAIATPVANRHDLAFERVVGPIVNTVVLRTDCSADPTLRALLRRARGTVLGALRHADVPFESLVERLAPVRDPSYHPLVQVMFVYHRDYAAGPPLPGLEVSPLDVHAAQTPFDLTFTAAARAGGLEYACQYDAALFDADTIEMLLAAWDGVLETLARAPATSVSRIAFPGACPVDAACPAGTRVARGQVQSLFEEAAARTPDAVAAVHDDVQITYGALNARADAVAARLVAGGVEPETRVGILVPRSIDMVIAMLGILKAGGAYVPLDGRATPERLALVLQHAGARLVVTRAALRSRVPREAGVLLLDDDDAPATVAARAVGARDEAHLAYVLFTSGSTGEPKGVAIAHRSLANCLSSMRGRPGFAGDDTLLAVTPLSFDIAALEILLPLIAGGRLVIASEAAAADGPLLLQTIREQDVTVLQATPATWRILLDAGWRGAPALEVLCGGEALPPELASELRAAAGHVWNLYGPTETTIWSTLARVDGSSDETPIGDAIANTRAHVLDAAWRPVPAGALGELYLAGDGLARGYVGSPDATAAAFVPDPTGDPPGSRMYRTGDLVRVLADGQLVWRGRVDHQVKLRGHRIELDAIARVLDAAPGVRESVVVRYADSPREPCLVAYVAAARHDASVIDGVRRHVETRLPAYMTPTAIVALDRLPRTAHNKIDRHALPRPGEADFRAQAEPMPPRTPTEEALVEIWRDVLGTAAIGVHDDFFSIGGSSVQATRIVLSIRERLGIDCPVRAFFDAPSIASLAAALAAPRAAGSTGPTAVIRRVPRDRPLLPGPQEERWLWREHDGRGAHANNMQYVLRFDGPFVSSAFAQTLLALQHRHEPLRMALASGDGGAVLAIADPVTTPPPIETLDLDGLPAPAADAALRRVATLALHRPFDPLRAPLWRAQLLRIRTGEHVAVLTFHHLIADGWSIELLLREAGRIYRALAGGRPAVLPALRVQYVDFAAWQRGWLTGPEFTPQLAYWLRRLKPPLPRLFGPPAASEARAHEMVRRTLGLAAPVVDAARSLGRSLGCTFFTTFVAAFKLALFHHAGQRDVRIGTMAANRSLPETDRMLGVFTNPIVLRTDVGRAGTFRELARHVRETIVEAYLHEQLPFEVLADTFERVLRISRDDLFQVMVFWQGAPGDPADLGNVRTTMMQPAAVEDERLFVPTTLDLYMDLYDTAGGLTGDVVYKASRFTAATVAGIVEDLQACLARAARDPDAPIATLI